jgi:hypothetical protein
MELATNKIVAVGVGVAVPLGVLLLLAIAWALWERSKRVKERKRPTEIDGTDARIYDSKYETKEQISGGELDGQGPPPQELQ